jgi:hypothetical protein
MKKFLIFLALLLTALIVSAQNDTAKVQKNHIDTVTVIQYVYINNCNCNQYFGYRSWQHEYYDWYIDFNYWHYSNYYRPNYYWHNDRPFTHRPRNNEYYGRRTTNGTVNTVVRTEQTRQTYQRPTRTNYNEGQISNRRVNNQTYNRPNRVNNSEPRQRTDNVVRERQTNTNNSTVRERRENNTTNTNTARERQTNTGSNDNQTSTRRR